MTSISAFFKKKSIQKFGSSEKSSIFASVFAYIWANGGCRETVPHLFFCFIEVYNKTYQFQKHHENISRRTI